MGHFHEIRFKLVLPILVYAFLLGFKLLLHFYEKPIAKTLIEKNLSKKIALAQKDQQLLEQKIKKGITPWQINAPTYSENKIHTYLYRNDTLVYWNNNGVPVDHIWTDYSYRGNLLYLKNGWYFILPSKPFGSYKTIGLIQVESNFIYRNDYLKDAFLLSPWGMIDARISLEESNTIIDTKNNGSFSIMLEKVIAKNHPINWLLQILEWMLLFLLFQRLITNHYPIVWLKKALQFLGVLLPLLIIYNHWFLFKETDLFSSSIYASGSILSSLAEPLFYCFYLVLIIQNFQSLLVWNNKTQKRELLITVIVILTATFGLFGIEKLTQSLVSDSNIPFEIDQLLSLNGNTFIALLIVLGFAISLVQLTKRLVLIQSQWTIKSLLLLVSCLPIFIFFNLSWSLIWGIYALLLIQYLDHRSAYQNNTTFRAILIALFALFVLQTIKTQVKQKQNLQQESLSVLLLENRDELSELMMYEFMEKLQQQAIDKISSFELLDIDLEEWHDQLSNAYFTNYLNKYELGILCRKNGEFTKNGNLSPLKEDFTDEDSLLETTGIQHLYYVRGNKGLSTYVIHFDENELSKNETLQADFTLVLRPKFITQTLGFPSLLLNKNSQTQLISNTNYGIYINNQLVQKNGETRFPLKINKQESLTLKNGKGMPMDYKTYNKENATLLVTWLRPNFISQLASFSYLFGLFVGLSLLYALFRFGLTKPYAATTLSGKIQLFGLLLILVSTGFYTTNSLYLFEDQFEEKNNTNIQEKAKSVLTEINHKLADKSDIHDVTVDYLNYLLNKFSQVFFTDISVYDLNGRLISSSRPKLFQSGLISDVMAPEAFKSIKNFPSTTSVIRQNIGTFNYLSAHIPFKNNEGKLLAYINLPYVAQQDSYQKELSTFLTATLNTYVWLSLLALILTVIISSFISRPLRLLQSRLSGLVIGGKNDPIPYQSNDEIGALVAAYNKKVLQLEESFKKIAHSEREMAWKEMAKQVSHEIKNPLTPMKLDIQHFQRTAQQLESADFAKINEFCKRLITQIDTLTSIASEFSNFAKLPDPILTPVNIHTLLTELVQMSASAGVNISLTTLCNSEVIIQGDRELLTRLFNNLIKNAHESKDHNLHIEVIISKKNNAVLVEVKDNGEGIPIELQDKIFQPNFTTKSSGMGLGLAICKRICDQLEAEIWFESNANEGTNFYIRLKSDLIP